MTLPDDHRPRVALYSHDTMGFGHIRRNILLAGALAAPPLSARVLLISGIREGGAFALPPGVDSVTLPAYRKLPDGNYKPRALGDDLARLVGLRSDIIQSALDRFEPSLLVVDNVPSGALGELRGALPMLQARGTKLVLGLRDVLDEPEAVRRQWWRQRNFETLRRHYDAVWVYGDTRVYDTAEACAFGPDIRDMLVPVGYLDPAQRVGAAAAPAEAATPYALCLVGGGQDGRALTEAFARAPRPEGLRGVILAGSMMPRADLERLRALAAMRPGLEVLDFVPEPLALMRGAQSVVAMGGYNTVTELLSLGRPTLIVPRVRPRQEQWIRARQLARMGLIDCLHPQALSPQAIGDWLAAPHPAHAPAAERIDFDGLANVQRQALALLAAPQRAGPPPRDATHDEAPPWLRATPSATRPRLPSRPLNERQGAGHGLH